MSPPHPPLLFHIGNRSLIIRCSHEWDRDICYYIIHADGKVTRALRGYFGRVAFCNSNAGVNVNSDIVKIRIAEIVSNYKPGGGVGWLL